ncbi:MAG: hypothetical protein OXM56_11650 [Gammaproteobacteria bacterium]|nr:hypothetical protein [Gammaproteobacteria bacterium]
MLTGLFDFTVATVRGRTWVRNLSYLEYAGRHPASGVPLADYVTAFDLLRMAFLTGAGYDGRRTVAVETWAHVLGRQEAVESLLLRRAGREPLEGFLALADFHRGKMPPKVADAIAEAPHVGRSNCLAAAPYRFAAQALSAGSPGLAGAGASCHASLEEDELVAARRRGETLARAALRGAAVLGDAAR